jgi:serine O-acetyltransferase
MPDPVANAINCMLDHMHAMDSKMEEMCKGLKALGAELGDMSLPPLGACEIGTKTDSALACKSSEECSGCPAERPENKS